MAKVALARMKRCGCFCTLLFVLIYCVVSWQSHINETRIRPKRVPMANEQLQALPIKPVIIYAATRFFKMPITSERFLSNCKSSKDWCTISDNYSDFDNADAVLYHNADFDTVLSEEIKNSRRLDVPYVLWSLESPANDRFRAPKDFVNWTMTYRRDADIWYPYGHVVKRKIKARVDYEEIWKMKNESIPPATWLASNCWTGNARAEVVGKLQEHGLKIDRWGRCGNPHPTCNGVDKQGEDCVVQLIRPYKFYVSFENSNCKDYATEKLYETMRSRMAVPLVLRRDIYEELGVPSSSFVALSDFKSIKDMADFVNDVAANKTRYLEYHQWREDYEVIPEHDDSTGFCTLCRRLAARQHMSEEERLASRKSYIDVERWHSHDMCDASFAKPYLGIF